MFISVLKMSKLGILKPNIEKQTLCMPICKGIVPGNYKCDI